MPANSPQKPSFPPLKCEQLEDRLVLTVHIVTAGTQPTEPVQSHSNLTTAANFIVHPTTQLTAANPSGTVQNGSEVSATSAATNASAGTTAALTNVASSGAIASSPAVVSYSSGAVQSASGPIAGGGPL